jgi:hypothetical protein
MFRNLTPAQFGPSDADNIAGLSALADKMVAVFDPPKDGPDEEENGVPALYTYFGQFIDHDITFDPVSSLAKQQGSRRTRRLPYASARSGQSLWPRSERPALYV